VSVERSVGIDELLDQLRASDISRLEPDGWYEACFNIIMVINMSTYDLTGCVVMN
jgi:hypothetical protein